MTTFWYWFIFIGIFLIGSLGYGLHRFLRWNMQRIISTRLMILVILERERLLSGEDLLAKLKSECKYNLSITRFYDLMRKLTEEEVVTGWKINSPVSIWSGQSHDCHYRLTEAGKQIVNDLVLDIYNLKKGT